MQQVEVQLSAGATLGTAWYQVEENTADPGGRKTWQAELSTLEVAVGFYSAM